MSDSLDLLPLVAEGTCVPLGGDRWAVRGRTGWYRCDAGRGTCSCGDFLYRRATVRSSCRHLRALASYLLLSEVIRAEFDQRDKAGKRGEEERAPLPSDAELRRMFA